jgi:hypothetical protein
MILRDIYVDKDRLRYSTDEAYAFKLRSRCACNFVGREVWKKQIRVPGFSRIVIKVAKDSSPGMNVLSTGVASIRLPTSDDVGEANAGSAVHEVYIDCMVRAFEFLRPYPEVVLALEEAITSFRSSGYRNVWIAFERAIRVHKLRAVLACELSIEHFTLRLQVSQGGVPLYDGEILRCDPDEVCFHHKFEDVVLEDGDLVVVARVGAPLFRLPLKGLC